MNEPGGPGLPPPLASGPQAPAGNPWELRQSLGFGAGLIEGVKLFIVNPAEAYAQTRRQGDFVSPLLFAVIIGWIGVLVGQIWQFILQDSLMSFLPPELQGQMAFGAMTGMFGLVIFLVVWPIFVVIGLFIWAGIMHLCLMMVGALDQSRSGFEGTFRVVSYSHVANLAQMIPIVGGFVTLAWSIVLMTIGGAELHQTSRGKALAAALLPLVVCCVCVAAGVGMAIFFGVLSGLDQ